MGKFVMKVTQDGGVMFNLLASNSQVICTSQTYVNESSCRHGIESIRKNCRSKIEDQTVDGFKTLSHPKYEIYKDRAGDFRFRLKAMNGEAIAASQGYKSKASCMNGIESIGKNAPDAEIEKAE
jgi:uncharacterized protein YegP (UPF0339 family)